MANPTRKSFLAVEGVAGGKDESAAGATKVYFLHAVARLIT